MEQGTLTLKNGTDVPFKVVRTRARRRSYALQVSPQGEVVFRAPPWVSLAELLRFGQSRYRFIGNRLREQHAKAAHAAALPGAEAFCPLPASWYLQAAKRLLPPRVRHWAAIVGVTVHGLTITSGRTVWGSCSSTGRIALSWRLLQVPPELREYVIVHELCHRRYMSHGPRFWALVGKYVPDYVEKRRRLNQLGGQLI